MYTLGRDFYSGYEMPLVARSYPFLISQKQSQVYQLLFIRKAGTKLNINHKTYEYKSPCAVFLDERDCLEKIEGDVLGVFFLPNMVNKNFSIDSIHAQDKTILCMDEYHYLACFRRNSDEEPVTIELNNNSIMQISNTLKRMEDQLSIQPDNYWPCRSKAYLIEILFHLCHSSNKESSETIDTEKYTIDKIIYYIQHHISESILISTLTKEFNINRTTLNEKFIKYLKMSPIKYINYQRIELSKMILANTAVPITEICLNVGINSPSHFSKIFKQATGLSPSQYRKKR